MNPKPSKDLGLNSGAYVLHALSAAETERFEALLAESEETRAEVTELADTAVELGLSVEAVEPPASLRLSIMDAIAVTPQLAPLPIVDLPMADLPAVGQPVIDLPAADQAASPHEIVAEPVITTPVISLVEERARRRWYARPMTTLVAAAAAVALLFGGGVAINALAQMQQSSSAASSISQIQAASDFQRRTVDVKNGGTATLIWSVSMRRSALLGTGMTKLPNGKTYELWYIGKNGAVAAGTFDADGSQTMSVVLTGKMDAGDSIGVTIEPAGGSVKPTGDAVAVVTTA